MIKSHLLRCRKGSATIEFALLAPALVLMLVGGFELSRLMWVRQTLAEVAYNTARCMSVSTTCDTADRQKAHAVERAAQYDLAITKTQVEPIGETICKSVPRSSSVKIRFTFISPLQGLLNQTPDLLQAGACYPNFA
ncbi:TadE/TadG family type IV pilus assembly protein [Croceicoccus sp. F390]|uniref:TadE/TadG family type IV pilus assembly protein n=1 Tax=Croceicoccus esteveae TaxID=3075597 RepID=A0ABU2ZKE0_9SPHN|nr:TadE/TadG family type IV pilus assembly protein [Croceicoccus sp. F390]MDT0576840.1 TadE/TadG family type IV pilus assembly protein [Croceicoccus sp. F390]